MPHTSHKKNPTRTKRTEIIDENGWVKITSSRNGQTYRSTNLSSNAYSAGNSNSVNLDTEPYGNFNLDIEPTVPDEEMTIEKLKQRYKSIETKWLNSKSWKTLHELLTDKAIDQSMITSTAIVFGTGSPSGYREGWIARHDVALYQIAVFKAVVDRIEQMTNHRPKTYAQEPCYNGLDTALLSSLDITCLPHPKGFEILSQSQHSFAYTPAAELPVQMRVLYHNPDILLTSGALDFFWRDANGHAYTDRPTQYSIRNRDENGDGEGGEESEKLSTNQDENERNFRVLESFNANHDGSKEGELPDLDVKDFPFFRQCLYWPSLRTSMVLGIMNMKMSIVSSI